jgi:hypothetical protein
MNAGYRRGRSARAASPPLDLPPNRRIRREGQASDVEPPSNPPSDLQSPYATSADPTPTPSRTPTPYPTISQPTSQPTPQISGDIAEGLYAHLLCRLKFALFYPRSPPNTLGIQICVPSILPLSQHVTRTNLGAPINFSPVSEREESGVGGLVLKRGGGA